MRGMREKMSQKKATDRSGSGMPEKDRPRKPYEAPRIVSLEPLEAIAGFCSKINPGVCGSPQPGGPPIPGVLRS